MTSIFGVLITAQEVFEIMADRFRAYLSSLSGEAGEPTRVYEPYPGAFDSILGPAAATPSSPEPDAPHEFQQNGPGIVGSDICTVCGKEREDHAALRADNERLRELYAKEAHAKMVCAEASERRLAEQGQAQGEAVAWPKILYVCEYCHENNPEMCGHDRGDLYVTPDGRWLCDGCLDEEGISHADCVSPPKLYGTPPSPEPDAELVEALKAAYDRLDPCDEKPELMEQIEAILARHRKQGGS